MREAMLIVVLLSQASVAMALERPALLEEREGCERWLGTASGNDPSVRLNLRLCPDGEEVRGEAQWSSLRSGWNVREVRGRWQGQQLRLADVRIVEERAEPGWRFCTIDRWELARSGDQLSGRYVSAACSDEAGVHLARVDEGTEPTRGGEAPGPTGDLPVPPPPLPPPPLPTPSGESDAPLVPTTPEATEAPAVNASGCGGCGLAGPVPPQVGALLVLSLALALRRSRRSRS